MLAGDAWILTVLGAGILLLVAFVYSSAFRRKLLAGDGLATPWITGSDVILTLGFVLIGIGVLGLVVGAVGKPVGRMIWRGLALRKLVLGISPTVFVVLVVSVLARLRGLTPEKAFGLTSPQPTRDVGRGAIVCLAVYPLLMGTSILLGYLFSKAGVKVPLQDAMQTVMAKQLWPEAAASVAIAVLMAPLLEEMAFRGFLLPAVHRRVGPVGAVILTAALFAFLHTGDHVFYAGPIFLLGLLLGWLYLRTGRLWVSVGCHGAFNALALVTTWLSPRVPGP